MRVLVACDSIAGLGSARASEVVASAFAERGATVAVVPLAAAGEPLREALLAADPGARLLPVEDSAGLGRALLAAPESAVLDLTAARADDLGRSALAAIAADPVEALGLARARWAGRDLVALVPEGEQTRPLTGLDGMAATRGRADGADLSEVLALDAQAAGWAAELGLAPAPGAGAASGLGLLVQAVGGRVLSPLALLEERFGLARSVSRADLVVTGAETLDFHGVGGPVVKLLTALAGEALRPVIAVTGRAFVSARELRLAGLEAVYPVLHGPEAPAATEEGLRLVAGRVADTWRW